MSDIKRILLVEDSLNDIELTLTALADQKLANEVVVTHDGEEALDYIYRRGEYALRNGGNPAVILLDLKMPKVDGLEVLRTIKSDPDLKHIPVVMLTSSAEECDVVESYNLNVNAYVVKPVAFQEFVEVIGRIGLFWAVINVPPSLAPASKAYSDENNGTVASNTTT
jgi:CheY-like chemotaxis protein